MGVSSRVCSSGHTSPDATEGNAEAPEIVERFGPCMGYRPLAFCSKSADFARLEFLPKTLRIISYVQSADFEKKRWAFSHGFEKWQIFCKCRESSKHQHRLHSFTETRDVGLDVAECPRPITLLEHPSSPLNGFNENIRGFSRWVLNGF